MIRETSRHYKYTEDFRRGRTGATKTFHYMDNNGVFKLTEDIQKLVIMSDIHSATPFVVQDLIDHDIIAGDTVVLTCGDMAGNGKMGGNADPLEDYQKILNVAFALYFVQGNHDTYNAESLKLKNRDGTPCCVDGQLIHTPLGTITGVNGISAESREDKLLHIYKPEVYDAKYRQALALRPDIIMTHQPPVTLAPATIHICGHRHADDSDFLSDREDGAKVINADNRILYIMG